MDDRNLEPNLEIEEQRRLRQHEAVRGELERDVTDQIAGRARSGIAADDERLSHVADRLHERAVNEAVQTSNELDRARGAARGSQVIDYLFFVVYAVLALRGLLALMAANPSSGFTQFVRTISQPFYAPFAGIVPSPSAEGGYTVALPIIVALAAYAVLHMAINRALRMVAHRKTAV